MKRIPILALLAVGCGDEQPLLVDTSEPFVEPDLSPSCEEIEGTWEATGFDASAVDSSATRSLGGDSLLIEFRDDGSFTSAHLTSEGLTERNGVWQALSGGRVRLDPFAEGLTEELTLTCTPSADRLALYGLTPFVFEGEEPETSQVLISLERVRGSTPR